MGPVLRRGRFPAEADLDSPRCEPREGRRSGLHSCVGDGAVAEMRSDGDGLRTTGEWDSELEPHLSLSAVAGLISDRGTCRGSFRGSLRGRESTKLREGDVSRVGRPQQSLLSHEETEVAKLRGEDRGVKLQP